MEGFFDNLLEKCAGKSASDRLHQRLIEKQFNQIISSTPVSSIDEPSVKPAQPKSTPTRHQSTPSTAIPASAETFPFVRPPLPPRSKSYIPEPARRPRFRREDRSYISLDGLLPDEEYANWYPPETPSPNNNIMQSSTPSNHNGSDSSFVSGAPLLYSVPKLPEMIGVGRFRRSKTATDEWFQQSLARELRAMSPLVQDGFFLRGPPIHPFQDRKDSDASATSSNYGQPVVSDNGSIIVRGFVSASSSATTSGTLGNQTQESSWRSDLGNQGATSPHVGDDCSCPDANADDRIRSSGITSSWESSKEIHQSPTTATTTPLLLSNGALPVATHSTVQQQHGAKLVLRESRGVARHLVDDLQLQRQQHKAGLALGGNQVTVRHLVGDLQVEQLSLADHEEAITEDEGDCRFKDVVGRQQTRKMKRNHGSKARVVRRRTNSRGTRKITKTRT
ncbi:hypothetical protein FGG08_000921 [Glutinoglossum americanum]|uniref:Uncharacterized protein n=1 Tax=Glutinoglossum americanum TaxID=1670608 RepID=A0A9P8L5Q5_9PEZI|nr:hypothetical protein FGG08_000921 [Glutinoglossum americanum]